MSRLTAIKVLPEPVARASSARLGCPVAFALGDLFHDGTDRRILIVAPGAFAAGVSLQERSGGWGFEREAHALLIPGAKLGRGRKSRDWPRCGGQSREAVKLDEQMAVGREDELDVVPPAFGITFGLIKAVTGRKAFFLGLDKGQGDGLGIDVYLDPQDIVDLSARAPPRLAVDDLDRACRLFAPNKVFCPAALVNGRVDEFCSGIGFVQGHLSSPVQILTDPLLH